jgi:pyruvate dehydrogenase E2 component (dihydrolipoamide acetyltransferase)
MAFSVRMPRIDANVEEGTIGRWLVGCGDRVRAGQPLVEIITDKASFELEAEREGVLRLQVAGEKSVVPVGYVIAVIGTSMDEPLPDVAAENQGILDAYTDSLLRGPGALRAEPQGGAARAEPAAAAPAGPQGVAATPAARRLAAQAGASLEAIAARVGGIVRRRDVEEELQRRQGEPRA